MMDNTHDLRRQSLRFLLTGGFTGTLGSTLCSAGVVFIEIAGTTIYEIIMEGPKPFLDSLSGNGLLWLLFSLLGLALLICLITFVPAFMAGASLAWLLRNETPTQLSSAPRYIKLGAVIGAIAGAVLTAAIMLPSLFISRMAHGGYGYQPGEAILSSIARGIEIMCASILTGSWVATQLRLRISRGQMPEVRPNTA